MNAQHSDAPDWARRALRVALGLILVAVIGLGLVVTSIVMGVRAASAVVEGVGADYPFVDGPTVVELEHQSHVVVYYPLGGPYPDGVCTVTGPGGQQIPRAVSLPMATVHIDGVEHVGEQAFPSAGPGTYTVVCPVEGYRAGPGLAYTEGNDRTEPAGAWVVLLMSAPALLLPAVLVPPLLVTSLVTRLVRGPWRETRERRAVERPLAIAITAGVVTGAAALVLLAMIAALILGGPDRRLPDADLVVLFLALPFVLGALITLGATLRWRQEASRIRPHFIPTEP